MSRCFPYPPPKYRKEDISKYLATASIKFLWPAPYYHLLDTFDLLSRHICCTGIDKIYALKLEKERDLTKERRKEKTEKKKKRKEKRDKSVNKSESSKHSEHGHKKRKHGERNGLQTMDGYQKAAAKDVIEQLERSGLTEEHELPYPTQGPCESPESTQNSSRSRKLEATNVPGGSHGSNIFRLRVPSQRHKDLKPTPVNDEPCFSGRATCKDVEATPSTEEPCFSGRATGARMQRDSCANDHSQYSSAIKSSNKITAILLEQKFCDNFHGCSSSAARGSMTSEAPMELERQPSSTIKSSKPNEAPAERELVESSRSHSSSRDEGSRKARKLERQFGDLVMNWKALPSLLNSGTEDLGWLYEKTGQHSLSSDAARSRRVSIAEPSHGSGLSSYQTRACYLPELEMYQLPYVVPL